MNIEIEELQKLENYELIDIRDANSFLYGHIEHAQNVCVAELETIICDTNKTYVVYCANGVQSFKYAQKFADKGYKIFCLKEGYNGYLKFKIKSGLNQNKCAEVEKSLQKKFRKNILTRFIKAIKQYNLIEPNDKIAVCISGGKDSFLLAKLFQELLRFTEIPFEVEYLVMDPGYNAENRFIIEKNAEMLKIPIRIFETNIFDNVFNIEKSPCYLCARMRRGYLYSEAKKLGCNKIALGHHYDDVIETILMGMLYGAQVQTMMPKLHSTSFEGMELIRPMYLVRECDIKHWRDYNDLYFLQCACKFTEQSHLEALNDDSVSSKRKKVKELIASLKKEDPQIDQNIFKSVENVNLNTVITYKDKNGVRHNFLEDYANLESDEM